MLDCLTGAERVAPPSCFSLPKDAEGDRIGEVVGLLLWLMMGDVGELIRVTNPPEPERALLVNRLPGLFNDGEFFGDEEGDCEDNGCIDVVDTGVGSDSISTEIFNASSTRLALSSLSLA
jgi:hypothetical protein